MNFAIKALSAVALAATMTVTFAADPIKIGVAGPFTGGSSSMGVSMRDGVRMATDEINKAGGVLGRQILLVERDDEAKNERGQHLVRCDAIRGRTQWRLRALDSVPVGFRRSWCARSVGCRPT